MAVHKKFNNGIRNNALGRGLDALISTEGVRTQGSSTINEIPLDQIEANPSHDGSLTKRRCANSPIASVPSASSSLSPCDRFRKTDSRLLREKDDGELHN